MYIMPGDPLTYWGRVTHLCVSKLTSISSDNGLSPGRRQAIIWNDAGILLIGPLGTNFSEILMELQTFSLKKIRLKMSSAKCRPFCLSLNVLRCVWLLMLLRVLRGKKGRNHSDSDTCSDLTEVNVCIYIQQNRNTVFDVDYWPKYATNCYNVTYFSVTTKNSASRFCVCLRSPVGHVFGVRLYENPQEMSEHWGNHGISYPIYTDM